MFKLDVAVRWEGQHWVAYNIGRRLNPHSAQNWSTPLEARAGIEDVLVWFRHANIIFLPGIAESPVNLTRNFRDAVSAVFGSPAEAPLPLVREALPETREQWAWANIRWGGHLVWQGQCERGAVPIRDRDAPADRRVRIIDPHDDWSTAYLPFPRPRW
jgi:hypothetical protein